MESQDGSCGNSWENLPIKPLFPPLLFGYSISAKKCTHTYIGTWGELYVKSLRMHETNVSQIVLYVLDLEYNQGINFTSPFQPLIPLEP